MNIGREIYKTKCDRIHVHKTTYLAYIYIYSHSRTLIIYSTYSKISSKYIGTIVKSMYFQIRNSVYCSLRISLWKPIHNPNPNRVIIPIYIDIITCVDLNEINLIKV